MKSILYYYIRSMKQLAVELEIEELAEFVFIKNVSNAVVDLELNGIEDVRDLYCFCVDLLSKGLVLICSKDGLNHVDLDSVTIDEFSNITKKLEMAGIKVNLNITPNDGTIPSHVSLGTKYASNPLPSDKLEDFHFSISTPQNLFDISFCLSPIHT